MLVIKRPSVFKALHTETQPEGGDYYYDKNIIASASVLCYTLVITVDIFSKLKVTKFALQTKN